MKKRILVSAAGTATAWHIINVIKREYDDAFDVWACDINPYYLVPSASIANRFIQVPSVYEDNYYGDMVDVLASNKVDVYVPLVDFDLEIFTCDNPDLVREGIISTGPTSHAAKKLIDKCIMSQILGSVNINTPKIYGSADALEDGATYLVKPRKGFGSQGVKKIKGGEISETYNGDRYVIQDLCVGPEVTVEIFNGGSFHSISRERIEVKAGVCTKARVHYNEELHEIVKGINNILTLPIASCIQFMRDSDNLWCVTDINLRLGAGTALSTAAGFPLVSAFLSYIKDPVNFRASGFFKEHYGDAYVVRYYEEMVTKWGMAPSQSELI